MARELIDLRAKVTVETDCVLKAEAEFEGCDVSTLVRNILHGWALRRIKASSVLQDSLDEQGIGGRARDAQGSTR